MLLLEKAIICIMFQNQHLLNGRIIATPPHTNQQFHSHLWSTLEISLILHNVPPNATDICNVDIPKKNHKVLPLSKKVKVLDLIRKNKSYSKVTKIYKKQSLYPIIFTVYCYKISVLYIVTACIYTKSGCAVTFPAYQGFLSLSQNLICATAI